MKTDIFQSCGHCWVFQICWHNEYSTFTASSFRIWNSSTGIPSPPLALFIAMLPKAHLPSHSRMSGTRWVITPSWLSGSKFSKPGFSNMWTVNSRYSSWSYKRQRNQRSNCQHLLDHWKSNRVPEKHLFLLYWLCQSLWLCRSQQTVENSSRDGSTRPPDLPLEKPVCRSGSNS